MVIQRHITTIIIIIIALAAAGLARAAAPVLAAPAAPVDIPVTQPDGTTFTARGWGDERQHGMETADGYTILLDAPSGRWVYAAAQNGTLTPARSASRQMLVVGRDSPVGLPRHARPAATTTSPQSAAARGTPPGDFRSPNRGTQPLLLIFINFANVQRTFALSIFAERFFAASGSIADFYDQASFGQLTLVPAAETDGLSDGIIEVTLGTNHPDSYLYSQTIAASALSAANAAVDFSAYDSDADGYVTGSEMHIIFVTAGYEQSYCGYSCPGPKMWGHQWSLDPALTLDGVALGASSADGDYGGYAMFGEIHGFGGTSNHAATIGIMAHELGHDLSWPDLYDTDGGSQGVGEWSIMGSGSWNLVAQYGDSPALPDAWLKWYQGWITPASAEAGQHSYTLGQASGSADALLLGNNPAGVDWDFYKQAGSGEYWLVENRQLSGYDAGLPGCGILIWHIDETRSCENDANADRERPLVSLVQADGQNDLYNNANRGDSGDPFPGNARNLAFSPLTAPRSAYYSGLSSSMYLTLQTSSCAASMTVRVNAPVMGNQVYLPFVGE